MNTDQHRSRHARCGTLILGVLLLIGGLVWTVGIGLPPLAKLTQDGWPGIWSVAIGAFLYPLMILPGGVGSYFGWLLILRPNKAAVKGGVGLIVVVGAIFVCARIDAWFPYSIVSSAFLLIAGLFALPIYIFASKHLIKHAGFEIHPTGEFVGRGIPLVFAFVILSVGVELVQKFTPYGGHHSEGDSDVWFLAGIAPFLLAYLTYRTWIHFLENRSLTTDH